MKKKPFRYAALVVALLLAFAGVAYAVEPLAPVSDSSDFSDPPDVSDYTDPSGSFVPVEVEEVPASTAPDVSVVLDPPVESDNAFVSALSSLFGTYTPRTQTVVTTYEDGTTVEAQEPVPGLAGLDWPWLAGVTLFCLVMYCLFRLVGVLLKK